MKWLRTFILLGGVLGFLYAKNSQEQLDLLSFKVFFIFLMAVVASILYMVEWAWHEDAESLECMQWCLGLLCLLISM